MLQPSDTASKAPFQPSAIRLRRSTPDPTWRRRGRRRSSSVGCLPGSAAPAPVPAAFVRATTCEPMLFLSIRRSRHTPPLTLAAPAPYLNARMRAHTHAHTHTEHPFVIVCRQHRLRPCPPDPPSSVFCAAVGLRVRASYSAADSLRTPYRLASACVLLCGCQSANSLLYDTSLAHTCAAG